MDKLFCFFWLSLMLFACNAQTPPNDPPPARVDVSTFKSLFPRYDSLFRAHPEYRSDGFDYPVGKPDAKNYYNAQGFGGKSYHLGDDWNAKTGGNSDLGQPIYSIAHGYVSVAKDFGGGWGKVVRVVHQIEDLVYVESLYAHCDTMLVKAGDWVRKGDKIATIGNNKGMYYAHLHLEIRSRADMPLGGGYSQNTTGYLDPTQWINAHRKP